jgi:hypothetical protein
MNISRRKFAQTVGLAVVGAGAVASAGDLFSQSRLGGGLSSLPGEIYADRTFSFTSETFTPFIGTIFQPSDDMMRRSTLQLMEVVKHDRPQNQVKGITGESFSLIFQLVGKKPLASKIHVFDHAALGNFSLFVTPVGRSGKEFEAVVNHLLAY